MAMMADATHSTPGIGYAGPLVDRTADDGPPPCCKSTVVGADKLVWYGGIAPDAMVRVRAALPHLEGVPDEDIYLCDGCREHIMWERILAPEEMPRAWPIGGGDAT
jgi:hypothetical protein